MLAPIAFDGIAVAELDAGDTPLFPEEESLVASVLPTRRREIREGRACARRALAKLGAPACALPADADRVPRWPDAIAGSITHTDGYVGAAVAWRSRYRSIGIDVEHLAHVRAEHVPLIATAVERRWLDRAGSDARTRTLLFSAKEAVYKCQFPLTRRLLDFLDVTVEIDDVRGSFRATTPTLVVDGRFSFSPSHVATIAVIR